MVILVMKNFLKSSVSVFALLSILSTLTPSLAMEGDAEEQKKPPYIARQIPEDLAHILTPFTQRHLQPLSVDEPMAMVFGSTHIPIELAQMIFSFLDMHSLSNIHNVSKLWCILSIEERQRRVQTWKTGDECDPLIAHFIPQGAVAPNLHIINPFNLLWVHNVLGLKALLYPPSDPSKYYDRIQNVITSEETVPVIICDLASTINLSPGLQRLVGRLYLNHIDLLDIHTTSLAAYVLNQVPGIRDILQQVVKALGFEPPEFAEYAKDFGNHSRLHQYLMALRLLAMGGDTAATDKISALSNNVQKFLQLNSSVPYEEQHTHLINQPLWGAYLQDSNSLSYQWQALQVLSNHKHNSEISLLRAFWEYSSIVGRKIVNSFRTYYLLELASNDRLEDRNHIIDTIRSFPTSNLPLMVGGDVISSPNVLLLILKEANKRLENDPLEDASLRFKVGWGMARYILATQDAQKFPEAETCLQKGLADKSVGPEEPSSQWQRNEVLKALLKLRLLRGNEADLIKTLQLLSESDLKRLISRPGGSVVEQYIYEGHYTHARFILEEAAERLKSDSLEDAYFCFKIGQAMAKCILETQDAQKFPEAETYLQKGLADTSLDAEEPSSQWQRDEVLKALLKLHLLRGNEADLIKTLQLLSESDLKRLISRPGGSLVEQYIYEGHYTHAMSILEEADKRFEKDDPFRLMIKLSLAKCILRSGDKGRFFDVEHYLNEILTHFQTRGWTSDDDLGTSDDDLGTSDDDLGLLELFKEDFSPFTVNDRYNVLDLRTALRIYGGRFEEAFNDLQPHFFDNCWALNALQDQLDLTDFNVPSTFLSLVGQKLFPHIFKPHDKWKDKLEHNWKEGNGEVLDDIMVATEEYSWFFEAAIARGLLARNLYEEFVGFCESLEEKEALSLVPGNPGNEEGKQKKEDDEEKETEYDRDKDKSK